jgi:hypothetical protein
MTAVTSGNLRFGLRSGGAHNRRKHVNVTVDIRRFRHRYVSPEVEPSAEGKSAS